jgi:hypothetical protein
MRDGNRQVRRWLYMQQNHARHQCSGAAPQRRTPRRGAAAMRRRPAAGCASLQPPGAQQDRTPRPHRPWSKESHVLRSSLAAPGRAPTSGAEWQMSELQQQLRIPTSGAVCQSQQRIDDATHRRRLQTVPTRAALDRWRIQCSSGACTQQMMRMSTSSGRSCG